MDIEVLIGASERSLALLRAEYPHLPFVEFPPYAVRYAKGNTQIPIILRQIPRLLQVMRQEHRLVKQLVDQHRIQGILSDNRYGVWSNNVPSVFICHQLAPSLPKGLKRFRKLLHHIHLFAIRNFDAIWIPDLAGEQNLSGSLSHAYPIPKKASFIGGLSRFSDVDSQASAYSYPELNQRTPDIAVILSGPEPQRSILEQLILDQARDLERECWIVGGKPEKKVIRCQENICQISFMERNDLGLLLQQAKVVISRSGYSSLMDYQALGLARLILIPTPGQTEQEVLGAELAKNHLVFVCEQHQFQLSQALATVEKRRGFKGIRQQSSFQTTLRQFIQEISAVPPRTSA